MIKIPKLIHIIWIGDKAFPYADEMQSFMHYNHGWEVILWTNENIPKVKNVYTYNKSKTWAGKSDVLRLEILEKYGGIYTDADSKCLKPLEPLIDELTCFGMNWGADNKTKVANGFLGCTQHHPAFKKMVANLDAHTKAIKKSKKNKKKGISIYSIAGARYITPYLHASKDFVQFDYGKARGERELIGTLADKKALENGYVIQYCDGSWRGKGRTKI